MPGCMEEVPETLTHRFWTCAAHEHLRSPNLLFPVDMQRCMVAIELNARRLFDERRATRDDPLAHQRETSTCYSHREKRHQGWVRRQSGRPWKSLTQCNTLSFLRMGYVSGAADARESLRSLIQGSGGLLGWPSA